MIFLRAVERKAKIRQKQKRGRKNVSLTNFSVAEKRAVAEQEETAKKTFWNSRSLGKCAFSRTDRRTLKEVEQFHGIKIKPIIEKLFLRFQDETLEVLDEGAGKSSFASGLRKSFGKNLNVTKTDIRSSFFSKTTKVKVMGLVKKFGKNRFHLVFSTAGGAEYSSLSKKALYQIVSVIKPGGVGVVGTNLVFSKTPLQLENLAKKFNITVKQLTGVGIVFTKNIGRKKKR